MKVRQIKRRYHARIIRAAVMLFPSCRMVMYDMAKGVPKDQWTWVRMTRYDSLASLCGNLRAVEAYNRTVKRRFT